MLTMWLVCTLAHHCVVMNTGKIWDVGHSFVAGQIDPGFTCLPFSAGLLLHPLCWKQKGSTSQPGRKHPPKASWLISHQNLLILSKTMWLLAWLFGFYFSCPWPVDKVWAVASMSLGTGNQEDVGCLPRGFASALLVKRRLQEGLFAKFPTPLTLTCHNPPPTRSS